MSKLLGEKVFDAVFSGLNCVDWHIDSWRVGLGFEKVEQGILVGAKGDDTTDIIWAGHADSGGMKCQLRVEAHLETPLGTTKYGDERKILVIKSDLSKLPKSGSLRDRARILEAVGEKILSLCKSFGSVELDLGLRGDVFFKARSLEELMLKVDLLDEDASDEEGKEDQTQQQESS